LGATAAQTMLGRDFRLTKHRGKFFHIDEVDWITATYHPSAVLRAPKKADRERMRGEFVTDLQKAATRFTSMA
jgi:DNA polymerase